ncbi:permease [candidate division WOR-1 bacterium RIFOXYC2_FULL_37_10]|uniref:Permease n=1 Tax=candidate division WOR-1 bacterium RIFOXYB2_FULL_37_13 TaxID=1802579 RepID=A0A1F4SKQ0_UNCSA|nr:MAG: permease [candidate division WOR-1 bacterium RIFOXYB2_FULL_37_13]OGC33978.1 MAG: permease [candidate division WOR-1 bacterium RIFOXYC2_FULL_37_10]
MLSLTIVFVICLLLSFLTDKQKTYQGCRKGMNMFLSLLPSLLIVLALVSVFLYVMPEKTLSSLLGAKSGFLGVVIAALAGSVALIPGFISYPLAAIFIKRGIPLPTVAVFITTLMMVGIMTMPIEIAYFGKKAAFMRNFLSFIGAFIIGLLIGVFL